MTRHVMNARTSLKGLTLEHYAAEVGQQLGDVDEKARRAGAVDHAVIVADADRQD